MAASRVLGMGKATDAFELATAVQDTKAAREWNVATLLSLADMLQALSIRHHVNTCRCGYGLALTGDSSARSTHFVADRAEILLEKGRLQEVLAYL